MRPARRSLAGGSPRSHRHHGAAPRPPCAGPRRAARRGRGVCGPPSLPGSVLVTGTRRRTEHRAGAPGSRGLTVGPEARPPGAEGSRPPRPLPAAVQAPPGPAAGQRRGAARRVPRGARGRAGPPGAGLPAAPCSGLGASVRLPPPASGTTEGDGQPGRPARPEDCPEGSSLGSSLRTQDPETPLPSHPASHKESNGEILDPGSASRISLLCGSRKEPLLGLRLPCSQ